jgi:hypothetical protein
MSIQNTHTRRIPDFASSIGSQEVAYLARALPWRETEELARILTTVPTDGKSVR